MWWFVSSNACGVRHAVARVFEVVRGGKGVATPSELDRPGDPKTKTPPFGGASLEVPPGFEPGMEVLQTSALPLGYGTRSLFGSRMGLPEHRQGPQPRV